MATKAEAQKEKKRLDEEEQEHGGAGRMAWLALLAGRFRFPVCFVVL